ncbi:MAG: hypothetical protein GY944_24720 [bacterium]|nr:hypothetical protein [bacterium]
MVEGGTSTALVHWIPFLPLAGAILQALVLLFARRSVRRLWVITLALAPVVLSFLFACAAFVELIDSPGEIRVLHDGLWSWIGLGVGSEAFSAELAFRFDPLSAALSLVLIGVSIAIWIYALAFMEGDSRGDAGYQRFFVYLAFVLTSLLVFVLADNLLVLLGGWIGIGIGSASLVGFWYAGEGSRRTATRSAVLAIAIDALFVLCVVALFWSLEGLGAHTTSFDDLRGALPALSGQVIELPFGIEVRMLTLVGLGLGFAACGRSAQVPFSFALSGVARAPAPAAALCVIAASTGIILCGRLFFLFDASPVASSALAWAGAITAVVGAATALGQRDLVAILVAAAVSQFGLAFVALGCGAYSAAIFQLVMTVIVTTLLILCAGSVIHTLDGERDIRRMGGLNVRLILTHLMALVGVFSPAVFLAREQAIAAAFEAPDVAGARALYGMALVATGLASWAISRFLIDVFWGSIRTPLGFRGEFNDPPLPFMLPLYGLAFFSVLGAAVNPAQIWGDLLPGGVEGSDSLAQFLGGVFAVNETEPIETGLRWQLVAASLLVTMIGFSTTYLFFVRLPRARIKLNQKLAPVQRALAGRDAGGVLERWIARPLVGFSRVWFEGRARVSAAASRQHILARSRSAGRRLLAGLRGADRGLPDLSLLFALGGALLLLLAVLQ